MRRGDNDDVFNNHRHHDRGHGSSKDPTKYSETKKPIGKTESSKYVVSVLHKQAERDVEKVQEFYSKMRAIRCHKCQASLTRDFDPKQHLGNWSNAMSQNGPTREKAHICSAKCPKSGCRVYTCLGCGKEPKVGINTFQTEAGTIDWCCSSGRMFAIWVFLARLDQVELKMQEGAAQKPIDQHKPGNAGKGYVSNKGFDNPFMFMEEAAMYGARAVRAIDFQSADTQTDGILGQLLLYISGLLPSPSSTPSSSFDKSPPSCLRAALRLSILIDKVGQLLRNDSITDISQRSSVYFPALNFVEVLGSHPATADLVTQERYYKCGTSGLEEIVSSGGRDSDGHRGKKMVAMPLGQLVTLADPSDGNAPPLASRLGNLVRQSETMLGLGKGSGGRRELRSEADQVTLELCKMIVKVHLKLAPAVSDESVILGMGNLGVSKQSDSDPTKAWMSFHREHCFELTEDVLKRHRYLENIERLHSPKGRIPYLMKEMAGMTTSLPEGIFVKASAETLGWLKCLIVGPDDTPYEGGLFEFDIECSCNYPNVPPHVFFRGTHNGLADMNPNLHRDGQVCLSLLGTFDGPSEAKWQAGKSTILSVLVSIQGMILTDEPWRNEPGNGEANNSYAREASRRYTLDRMALTVRFAILPWLLDPSWSNNVLWRRIVKGHFSIHANKILQTVRRWSHISPGIRNFREPTHSREAVVTYLPNVTGIDLRSKLEHALKRFL